MATSNEHSKWNDNNRKRFINLKFINKTQAKPSQPAKPTTRQPVSLHCCFGLCVDYLKQHRGHASTVVPHTGSLSYHRIIKSESLVPSLATMSVECMSKGQQCKRKRTENIHRNRRLRKSSHANSKPVFTVHKFAPKTRTANESVWGGCIHLVVYCVLAVATACMLNLLLLAQKCQWQIFVHDFVHR